MFDNLKNRIGAAYEVAPAKYRNSYLEGELLAWAIDQDGSIIKASLTDTSAALPGGVVMDPVNGDITRGSLAVELEAGSYPLEIETLNASGGCTLQTITLSILGDIPAEFSLGAAANQRLAYFDEAQNAKPWVIASFTDANVVGKVRVTPNSSLPAGMVMDDTTGEITVDDELKLKADDYVIEVEVQDLNGEYTYLDVAFSIKADDYAPTITFSEPVRVSMLTEGQVLITFDNPEDGGIAAVGLKDSSNEDIVPEQIGLVLEEHDATNNIWQLRIGDLDLQLERFQDEVTSKDGPFYLDPNRGVYYLPFSVSLTDEIGIQTTTEHALALLADGQVAYVAEPTRAHSTYHFGDVVGRFTINQGSIVGAVETLSPEGEENPTDMLGIGLSFDHSQGYALVVTDPAVFQSELGKYSLQRDDVISFGSWIRVTDSDGIEHDVLIDIQVIADTTGETVLDEAQQIDRYTYKDRLGTLLQTGGKYIETAVLNGMTDQELYDQFGLGMFLEDGQVTFKVLNPEIFRNGVYAGRWLFEEGFYTRTFAVDIIDSEGNATTASIALRVLPGELIPRVSSSKEDLLSADGYVDDQLLLSFTDIPNGGLSEARIFEQDPSAEGVEGLEALDAAALLNFGIKLNLGGGKAEVRVDETNQSFKQTVETFPEVNRTFGKTLYIETVDNVGQKTVTEFKLEALRGCTDQGNNIAVVSQTADYFQQGAIVAGVVAADQLEFTSFTADQTELTTLGLRWTQEGVGILRLRVANASTFASALSSEFTLAGGLYTKDITLTTINECNEQNIDTITITVDLNESRLAGTPFVLDDLVYATGHLIAEIENPNGVILDNGTAEIRDTSTGNPITPSTIGLQLEVKSGSGNLEIQLNDLATYRAHLQSNSNSVTHNVYVESSSGGGTLVSVNFLGRVDDETTPVVLTQHENLYDGEMVVVTFTDTDGTGNNIATLVADNPTALGNLGLEVFGTSVRVISKSAFQSALLSNYTDTGTQYTASFTVTTTDGDGGVTENLPVNFVVNKDQEADETVLTVGSYGQDVPLVRFIDLDGWDSNPDIVITPALPNGTGIVPGGNGTEAFLSVTDFSSLVYFNGSLTAACTDQHGGTTSITFSLTIEIDRPTSINQHSPSSWVASTPLVTFTDLDGWDATPQISYNPTLPDYMETIRSGTNAILRIKEDATPTQITYFSSSVTATCTDVLDNVIEHTFNLLVDVDRPLVLVGPVVAPRNQDDYKVNEIVAVIKDPDTMIQDSPGTTYQLRLSESGSAVSPATYGLKYDIESYEYQSVTHEGVVVLRVADPATFIEKIQEASPTSRTYYIWVQDEDGGTDSIAIPITIIEDVEVTKGTEQGPFHEDSYEQGDDIVTMTSTDGVMDTNPAVHGIADTSGGALVTGERGFQVNVSGNTVTFEVGTPATFIAQLKLGGLTNGRTYYARTVDTNGGISDTRIDVYFTPDNPVAIHAEADEETYADITLGHVLTTIKDPDGTINPGSCTIKDGAAELAVGTSGFRVVQSATDASFVDLIVDTYDSARNAVTDFLSSMGASTTVDTTKTITVEGTDAHGKAFSINTDVTVWKNDVLPGVSAEDPKHQHTYGNGDPLATITDADGIDEVSVVQYPEVASLGLQGMVLGTPGGANSVQLFVADGSIFMNNIGTGLWQHDSENELYELTLTIRIKDMRQRTIDRPLVIRVTEDQEPETSFLLARKNEEAFEGGEPAAVIVDPDGAIPGIVNTNYQFRVTSGVNGHQDPGIYGLAVTPGSGADDGKILVHMLDPEDFVQRIKGPGPSFNTSITYYMWVKDINDVEHEVPMQFQLYLETEANPVVGPPSAAKHEFAWSDEEVLMTMADESNGGISNAAGAYGLKNNASDSSLLNLSDLGMIMTLIEVNGFDQAELKIISRGDFISAIGPGLSRSFYFYTKDVQGGETTRQFTVSYIPDNPVAIHAESDEETYDNISLGHVLTTIKDPDGIINPASCTIRDGGAVLPVGTSGFRVVQSGVDTDYVDLIVDTYDSTRNAVNDFLTTMGASTSVDTTKVITVSGTDAHNQAFSINTTVTVWKNDVLPGTAAEGPEHQHTYQDGDPLATITDNDGIDELTVLEYPSASALANMGMILGPTGGATSTQLFVNVASTFMNNVGTGLWQYDSDNEEYFLPLNVRIKDMRNRILDRSVTIRVTEDEAPETSLLIAQKNEDAYSMGETAAIVIDPDGSIPGIEGSNYQFRITSGEIGHLDPAAFGMNLTAVGGQIRLTISDAEDFVNNIKGPGPSFNTSRTYYMWVKDVNDVEHEVPLLMQLYLETEANPVVGPPSTKHEFAWGNGEVLMTMADESNGGISNVVGDYGLKNNTSDSSVLSLTGTGMTMTIINVNGFNRAELKITNRGDFIDTIDASGPANSRTFYFYTKDAQGGITHRPFTLTYTPDNPVVFHSVEDEETYADTSLGQVLATIKDPDGVIEPGSCSVWDGATPLPVGTSGFRVIQSGTDPDYVDLIVDTYDSTRNAVTDFLSSMGASTSVDTTKNITVQGTDAHSQSFSVTTPITVWKNDLLSSVAVEDAENENTYGTGALLATISDQDGMNSVGIVEYDTAGLNALGIVLASSSPGGAQNTTLNVLSGSVFKGKVDQAPWAYNSGTNTYDLTLTARIVDSRLRSLDRPFTLKVTPDEEPIVKPGTLISRQNEEAYGLGNTVVVIQDPDGSIPGIVDTNYQFRINSGQEGHVNPSTYGMTITPETVAAEVVELRVNISSVEFFVNNIKGSEPYSTARTYYMWVKDVNGFEKEVPFTVELYLETDAVPVAGSSSTTKHEFGWANGDIIITMGDEANGGISTAADAMGLKNATSDVSFLNIANLGMTITPQLVGGFYQAELSIINRGLFINAIKATAPTTSRTFYFFTRDVQGGETNYPFTVAYTPDDPVVVRFEEDSIAYSSYTGGEVVATIEDPDGDINPATCIIKDGSTTLTVGSSGLKVVQNTTNTNWVDVVVDTYTNPTNAVSDFLSTVGASASTTLFKDLTVEGDDAHQQDFSVTVRITVMKDDAIPVAALTNVTPPNENACDNGTQLVTITDDDYINAISSVQYPGNLDQLGLSLETPGVNDTTVHLVVTNSSMFKGKLAFAPWALESGHYELNLSFEVLDGQSLTKNTNTVTLRIKDDEVPRVKSQQSALHEGQYADLSTPIVVIEDPDGEIPSSPDNYQFRIDSGGPEVTAGDYGFAITANNGDLDLTISNVTAFLGNIKGPSEPYNTSRTYYLWVLDENNVSREVSFNVAITLDTDAAPVAGSSSTTKHEFGWSSGDIILTMADADDGGISNTAGHYGLKNNASDGSVMSLTNTGLRININNVGGNNQAELEVINRSQFISFIGGSNTRSLFFYTQDVSGGETNYPFTVAYTPDEPVAVRFEEDSITYSAYTGGEIVATIEDPDGDINPATCIIKDGSTTLTVGSSGLKVVQNTTNTNWVDVVVDTYTNPTNAVSDFLSTVGASTSSTQFKDLTVEGDDAHQQDFSVNIRITVVKDDSLPGAVLFDGTPPNENACGANKPLVTISDADYISTVTCNEFTASQLLNDMGLRIQTVSNTTTASVNLIVDNVSDFLTGLTAAGSNWTLNGDNYEVSLSFRVVDQPGLSKNTSAVLLQVKNDEEPKIKSLQGPIHEAQYADLVTPIVVIEDPDGEIPTDVAHNEFRITPGGTPQTPNTYGFEVTPRNGDIELMISNLTNFLGQIKGPGPTYNSARTYYLWVLDENGFSKEVPFEVRIIVDSEVTPTQTFAETKPQYQWAVNQEVMRLQDADGNISNGVGDFGLRDTSGGTLLTTAQLTARGLSVTVEGGQAIATIIHHADFISHLTANDYRDYYFFTTDSEGGTSEYYFRLGYTPDNPTSVLYEITQEYSDFGTDELLATISDADDITAASLTIKLAGVTQGASSGLVLVDHSSISNRVQMRIGTYSGALNDFYTTMGASSTSSVSKTFTIEGLDHNGGTIDASVTITVDADPFVDTEATPTQSFPTTKAQYEWKFNDIVMRMEDVDGDISNAAGDYGLRDSIDGGLLSATTLANRGLAVSVLSGQALARISSHGNFIDSLTPNVPKTYYFYTKDSQGGETNHMFQIQYTPDNPSTKLNEIAAKAYDLYQPNDVLVSVRDTDGLSPSNLDIEIGGQTMEEGVSGLKLVQAGDNQVNLIVDNYTNSLTHFHNSMGSSPESDTTTQVIISGTDNFGGPVQDSGGGSIFVNVKVNANEVSDTPATVTPAEALPEHQYSRFTPLADAVDVDGIKTITITNIPTAHLTALGFNVESFTQGATTVPISVSDELQFKGGLSTYSSYWTDTGDFYELGLELSVEDVEGRTTNGLSVNLSVEKLSDPVGTIFTIPSMEEITPGTLLLRITDNQGVGSVDTVAGEGPEPVESYGMRGTGEGDYQLQIGPDPGAFTDPIGTSPWSTSLDPITGNFHLIVTFAVEDMEGGSAQIVRIIQVSPPGGG